MEENMDRTSVWSPVGRGQFVMGCSYTSFPPLASSKRLRARVTAQNTPPNAICPLSQRDKHHSCGWPAWLPADKAWWGVRAEGHRGVLFGFFFCLFLKASLEYNFRTIKHPLRCRIRWLPAYVQCSVAIATTLFRWAAEFSFPSWILVVVKGLA